MKLEEKHHDLMSISMMVRVLLRMKLSVEMYLVIQCCMTRTMSSSKDLFSSLSRSWTVEVFMTLLRMTHRFWIVGESSERPRGRI